jgi:carbon-monoxide dehydrogenase medium subunit
MDIAVVNVGFSLTLADNGECQACRIVLGAVGPTIIRAHRAEAALRGERITSKLLAQAGSIAAEEARPIDDVRASERYRRELVNVLVQRAGSEALARRQERKAG